jgi:hypothetical protein
MENHPEPVSHAKPVAAQPPFGAATQDGGGTSAGRLSSRRVADATTPAEHIPSKWIPAGGFDRSRSSVAAVRNQPRGVSRRREARVRGFDFGQRVVHRQAERRGCGRPDQEVRGIGRCPRERNEPCLAIPASRPARARRMRRARRLTRTSTCLERTLPQQARGPHLSLTLRALRIFPASLNWAKDARRVAARPIWLQGSRTLRLMTVQCNGLAGPSCEFGGCRMAPVDRTAPRAPAHGF